jgi:hypothetical protein
LSSASWEIKRKLEEEKMSTQWTMDSPAGFYTENTGNSSDEVPNASQPSQPSPPPPPPYSALHTDVSQPPPPPVYRAVRNDASNSSPPPYFPFSATAPSDLAMGSKKSFFKSGERPIRTPLSQYVNQRAKAQPYSKNGPNSATGNTTSNTTSSGTNSSSSSSSTIYSRFSGYKPFNRWDLTNDVSLRTGYINGNLVLRLSDGNEVDWKFVPPQPDQSNEHGCFNTVMIPPREFSMLQSRYMDMLSATVNPTPGFQKEFHLTQIQPGELIEKKSPVTSVHIGDNQAVFRSWYNDPHPRAGQQPGRLTLGKVVLSREQLFSLGKYFGDFDTVFSRFPHDMVADPIAQIMLDITADMILTRMKRSIPDIHHDDFVTFPREFTSVFFYEYTHCMNMGMSTNILRRVRDKMQEVGLTADFDLYTYFHQCVNQLNILLMAMYAIL